MHARPIILRLAIILLSIVSASDLPAQTTPWRYRGTSDGGYVYAVARSADGGAFAASMTGLFRSTDDGGSWNKVGSELNGLVWYVVGGGRLPLLLATDSGTIYRSTDRGVSWSRGATLDIAPHIRKFLAIDSSGAVFSATKNRAIVRSTDAGATWEEVRPPSSNTPMLQVGPDGSVYAVFNLGSVPGQDRVARSTDGGRTWTDIRSATLPASITGFSIAPNGTLYLVTYTQGVHRSDDGGSTWTPVDLGAPNSFAFDVDVAGNGTVFLAAYNEVFESSDGGRTWWRSLVGDDGVGLSCIAANYGTPLVGTSFGIYRSFGAEGWLWSSRGVAGSINRLVCGPGGIVYGIDGNLRLFRSSDGGITWVHLRHLESDIAVAESGTIFTARHSGESGFYRSTDRGTTWSRMQLDSGLLVLPTVAGFDGELYGAWNSLLRSTDDGVTWTEIATLAPSGQASALYVTKDRIYCGTQGGDVIVFDRKDGAHIRTSVPRQYPIHRIFRSSNGVLIVKTSGYGMFRSTDDGASWNACGDNAWLRESMDASLDSAERLWATNTNGGAWVSTDDGLSWRAEGEGLLGPANPLETKVYMVPAAACGSDGTMYVATTLGVFAKSTIAAAPRERSAGDGTMLLTPNPAMSIATLHFDLDRETTVAVAVRDLLGNEAMPAQARRLSPESHALSLDLSMLPNGAYFCTVDVGGRPRTTWLVVAR